MKIILVIAALFLIFCASLQGRVLICRKIIGVICKPFSPGYGSCYSCGRTWNICKGHDTNYTPGTGCFPLCEPCWKSMTPEQRLPFYQMLIQSWRQWSPVEKEQEDAIIKAVLEGK
jgi:hypothetical protein